MKIKINKLIDKIFELGILIKSFFGFFEILVGLVLATSGRLAVNNLIIALTQQEILDDPQDFFANYLIKISNNLIVGVNVFAVVYLVFHGAINIFLGISLLKNKTWAYFWAIAGFGLFIIYQIFRYFHTYSPLLLVLTAFDILVVAFVFLEYRKNRKKNKLSTKHENV